MQLLVIQFIIISHKLSCRKKNWQLTSQCCWNRERPWHASELVSFLVGLRTYQHPGMTNKCTINSQIITLLLHVSTLSCHPKGACNQYLVKLHKYFKCSCWWYNLQLMRFTQVLCNVKHLNCKLHYQQMHLKYLCNLARYWLQAP